MRQEKGGWMAEREALRRELERRAAEVEELARQRDNARADSARIGEELERQRLELERVRGAVRPKEQEAPPPEPAQPQKGTPAPAAAPAPAAGTPRPSPGAAAALAAAVASAAAAGAGAAGAQQLQAERELRPGTQVVFLRPIRFRSGRGINAGELGVVRQVQPPAQQGGPALVEVAVSSAYGLLYYDALPGRDVEPTRSFLVTDETPLETVNKLIVERETKVRVQALQLDTLERDNAALSRKLSAEVDAKAATDKRVRELEERLLSGEGELRTAEQSKRHAAALEREKREADDEVAMLRRSLRDTEGKVVSLQRRVAGQHQLDAQRDRAREVESKMREQFDKAQAESEGRISSLQARLTAMEQEYDKRKAAEESLQKEAAALRAELDEERKARRMAEKSHGKGADFRVGQRVRVRDKPGESWLPGEVTEVRNGDPVVRADGSARAFTWGEVEPAAKDAKEEKGAAGDDEARAKREAVAAAEGRAPSPTERRDMLAIENDKLAAANAALEAQVRALEAGGAGATGSASALRREVEQLRRDRAEWGVTKSALLRQLEQAERLSTEREARVRGDLDTARSAAAARKRRSAAAGAGARRWEEELAERDARIAALRREVSKRELADRAREQLEQDLAGAREEAARLRRELERSEAVVRAARRDEERRRDEDHLRERSRKARDARVRRSVDAASAGGAERSAPPSEAGDAAPPPAQRPARPGQSRPAAQQPRRILSPPRSRSASPGRSASPPCEPAGARPASPLEPDKEDGAPPRTARGGDTPRHSPAPPKPAAQEAVRYWEENRRLRRQVAALKQRQRGGPGSVPAAEHEKVRQEAGQLKEELRLTRQRLQEKIEEMHRRAVDAHTFEKVKTFKHEIMRMEEENDRLRRALECDKEAEIRGLQLQLRRRDEQVLRLERRLRDMASRFGAEDVLDIPPTDLEQAAAEPIQLLNDLHSDQPQLAPKCDSLRAAFRALEDQLLSARNDAHQARFAREAAINAQQRAERHLRDLLSIAPPQLAQQKDPLAAGDAAGALALLPKQSREKQVHDLQQVIEGMKFVVQKLQRDNDELRRNGVSNQKYVELLKDYKQRGERLSALERELSEAKQRHPPAGGPAGSLQAENAALRRKLRREQEQLERLRRELAEQRLDPPAADTVEAAGRAVAEAADLRAEVERLNAALVAASAGSEPGIGTGDLRRQLEHARAETAEGRAEAEAQRARCAELQQKLDDSERARKAAEEAAAQLRSDLALFDADFFDEVEGLKAKAEQLQVQNAQLQRRLREAEGGGESASIDPLLGVPGRGLRGMRALRGLGGSLDSGRLSSDSLSGVLRRSGDLAALLRRSRAHGSEGSDDVTLSGSSTPTLGP